ncbi:hypothetical protein ACJIZ3_019237 [Penstemon smallii]|uniref:WW domain-containing protein n=1 Tax=Penstemon smallii TaxID=265156 RepID=A0ABD3T0N1_9LAMI
MISLKSSKLCKNEVFPVEEISLTKKRKWDDPTDQEFSEKLEKIKSLKPEFDTNFQNETPFPLEWQRCLDIKSGEIYFFNTRTHKRALDDPRTSPEPLKSNPAPMSLELQLNLPSQSLSKNHDHDKISPYSTNQAKNSSKRSKDTNALTRSPSWLTFEEDEQEMVTAVCKKCYMLVMMNKSSLACPNCKFVHPSEPGPNLFNQRLSLLC